MSQVSSALETLEDDTYGFWVDFARGPGGEVRDVGGATLFRTGIPTTSYNGAAGPADDVDAALAHVRSWGLSARWLVSSTAETFEAALIARGLTLLDEWPGMVALVEDLPQPKLDGITMEVVQDEGQAETWGEVFCDAFGMSPDAARFARAAHAWPCLHEPNRTYLILRREGEPVATGLLRSTPGVAGVYGIAVRRAFQRRGLGALATLLTVREGARRGAQRVVLQATKEGFPVYEKLGFQTICSFKSWRVA
jgi:ribosomal protein S18 acetylase RimI-like enzyme